MPIKSCTSQSLRPSLKLVKDGDADRRDDLPDSLLIGISMLARP